MSIEAAWSRSGDSRALNPLDFALGFGRFSARYGGQRLQRRAGRHAEQLLQPRAEIREFAARKLRTGGELHRIGIDRAATAIEFVMQVRTGR